MEIRIPTAFLGGWEGGGQGVFRQVVLSPAQQPATLSLPAGLHVQEGQMPRLSLPTDQEGAITEQTTGGDVRTKPNPRLAVEMGDGTLA